MITAFDAIVKFFHEITAHVMGCFFRGLDTCYDIYNLIIYDNKYSVFLKYVKSSHYYRSLDWRLIIDLLFCS